MLALTRKKGEALVINNNIEITRRIGCIERYHWLNLSEGVNFWKTSSDIYNVGKRQQFIAIEKDTVGMCFNK